MACRPGPPLHHCQLQSVPLQPSPYIAISANPLRYSHSHDQQYTSWQSGTALPDQSACLALQYSRTKASPSQSISRLFSQDTTRQAAPIPCSQLLFSLIPSVPSPLSILHFITALPSRFSPIYALTALTVQSISHPILYSLFCNFLARPLHYLSPPLQPEPSRPFTS